MKRFLIALNIISICSYSGCKLSDSEVIDPEISSSLIASAQLQINKVDTDTIFSNGEFNLDDVLAISTIATAKLHVVENMTEVLVTITDDSGNETYGRSLLRNNGVSPDVSTGDSTFSGVVNYSIPRSVVGELRAVFETNNLGNKVILPIAIVRANTAPVLSNLNAPDTVIVPSGNDVNLLTVSVVATDSQGLENITRVFLTIVRAEDSSTVSTFDLFDDGGHVNQPPLNIPSNDIRANDGIYTLTIPVTSSTLHNIERIFEFRAIDKSKALSDLLEHRIYFK